MAGATILDIVYGMDVETEDGASYFMVIEKAIHILSEIGNAGSYLGKPLEAYSMHKIKLTITF